MNTHIFVIELFRNSLCLIKLAIFVQICGKILRACVNTWSKNLVTKLPKKAILASKWSFERALIFILILMPELYCAKVHEPNLKFHESRSVTYPAEAKLLDYVKPIQVTTDDSGIAGIDSIYCINLDIRKEKWKAMQEKLSKQGLNANRISAINGWTGLSKDVRRRLKAPNKAKLSPGQIGCFLSHLSILKDAATRGFSRILILEDDVEFVAPMKELEEYLEILSQKDPDWDMLFVDDWIGPSYGIYKPVDRPHSRMSEVILKPKEALVSSKLSRVYYRHGMYAIVVSKKGIQKILEHFTRHSLTLAIDIEMNHIDQIKMYETVKNFVTVNLAISDTEKKPKKQSL